MDTTRIYRNLLTCALLSSPLLGAVGCGDDNGGGDDDDDVVDAGDAGDGGNRPSEAGTPDGGRPDGSMDIDSGGRNDASIDAAMEASIPDSNVPPGPDASNPQNDGGPMSIDGSAGDAGTGTGDTWGITSGKRLVLFTRATGVIGRAQAITGLPDTETIVGADVRPSDSTVIALSNAGKLYTVNPQTGAATLKSTLAADPTDATQAFTALAGTAFGVDFNPVADRLRIVSNTGQNLRVNVDTGATITDGSIAPATPGLAAAAYTNSFATACRTQLFVIDAAGRTLLVQDPPNEGTLTVVGSLGDASIGQIHSFEIVTAADGSSVALVSATTSGGERVSQLNLASGALSSPQSLALNNGERLDAIFAIPPTSAPAQPAGELLAVTTGDKLISFNRSAPSRLCTSTSITGLGSGESVLGIDVRPADGQLYALTQSKVYTVALATGAATVKSTLAADPADTSEPFAGITGTDVGIGFNPVPDRLRVLTGTGVSLRINVDSGATITDTTLTGAPAVAGLAYTNSFAGARSTTLYAIDSTNNDLVRVGGNPGAGGDCPNVDNPNCGTVTEVGGLNVTGDVTAIGGFDIDAVNGGALAALTLGDSTTSTLYNVNLTTGAATLPAGVANATIGGGERVRALTLAANPTATVYAVTATNRLIGFSPSTPGTLTRNVAITGLQASEELVGIDVRPLDGKLYAVGSSSRLYAIDTTSGAATVATALTATNGTPFALPAGTYGLDFSPPFDQLRLVNGDEQNFRVFPSDQPGTDVGEVITDTALSPAPSSGISGAAYTNNFVGATATTLYVVSGAMLYAQGGANGAPSPTTGLLTELGATGITANGGVGFDIVGGHNGLALAAISTDGMATALYSVNLATGAATALNASNNTVAETGNAPLRGLAVQLR